MRKTMKLASLGCLVLLVFALMFTACDIADEQQAPDDMTDETTLDSAKNEATNGTHSPGGETHVHSYGEWIITRESTCSVQGSKERTCDCGAKDTQSIATLEHSFGEWTVTRESTCAVQGSKERICDCGAKDTQSIAATGLHTFGEWITVQEPSMMSTGLKEKSCQTCGQTEQETIDKLPCPYNTNSDKLATYNGIQITELEYFSNGITIVSVNAKTSSVMEFVVRNDTGKAIGGYSKIYYKEYSDDGIVQNSDHKYLDDLDPGESCFISITINQFTKTIKFGEASVDDGEDFGFTGELSEYHGIEMNALPYTTNGITITSINAKNDRQIEFIVRNDTGKAIGGYSKIYYKAYTEEGIVQTSDNKYLDDLDPGESCFVTISINEFTKTIKFGQASVDEGEAFYTGEMSEYYDIKTNTLPYSSNGMTITSINAKNDRQIEFIVRNDTGKAIGGYSKVYYKILTGDGIIQNTANAYLDDLDPGESCYVTISINEYTNTIKFGEIEVDFK